MNNGVVDPAVPNHNCTRNFDSAPGSMEASIIGELLEILFDKKNIVVEYYVSDNDSATMATIKNLNLYKDLNKFTNRRSCYLHASRNYTNKLKALEPKCKILADLNFAELMRKAVRIIIKKYNAMWQSGLDYNTAIKNMEEELLNAPFHILQQHGKCGTFCTKKNDASEVPIYVPSATEMDIMAFTSQLTAMSSSLLYRKTTNTNESFNALASKKFGKKVTSYSQSNAAETR